MFNVLELFERSQLGTYRLLMNEGDPAFVEELIAAFREAGIDIEDWTGNVLTLCKLCSEGTAHEHHAGHRDGEWNPARSLGIAAGSIDDVFNVLATWGDADPSKFELTCELPPAPMAG